MLEVVLRANGAHQQREECSLRCIEFILACRDDALAKVIHHFVAVAEHPRVEVGRLVLALVVFVVVPNLFVDLGEGRELS